MEVRILHKFHDRADFTKVYPVGETFTFDDARAEHLIKRGLAEPVQPVVEEVVEESPVEETVEPAEVVAEDAAIEEEAAEEAAEEAEAPVVEEVEVKPVATKRRSASKDN